MRWPWTAGCGLAGVTGRAHGGHRRNHRSSKAFDLRGGHVAATGTSVDRQQRPFTVSVVVPRRHGSPWGGQENQNSAGGIHLSPMRSQTDVSLTQAARHSVTGDPTPSSATSKTHFSSVIPSLTEAVVAPECRTTLDSSSRTTPKTMGSIPLRIG